MVTLWKIVCDVLQFRRNHKFSNRFTPWRCWMRVVMPTDSGAPERWRSNPLVVTPGFSQLVESELADSSKIARASSWFRNLGDQNNEVHRSSYGPWTSDMEKSRQDSRASQYSRMQRFRCAAPRNRGAPGPRSSTGRQRSSGLLYRRLLNLHHHPLDVALQLAFGGHKMRYRTLVLAPSHSYLPFNLATHSLRIIPGCAAGAVAVRDARMHSTCPAHFTAIP